MSRILMKLRPTAPCAVLALAALLSSPRPVLAQSLGCAKSFGVLGSQGITNTGATTIKGNVGNSPLALTSITGFETVTLVNGVVTATDVAATAQGCALSAYNSLGAGTFTDLTVTGLDNIGTTLGTALAPGNYAFTNATALLNGDLYLNFVNPNSKFVFKFAFQLTTGSNSNVIAVGPGGAFGQLYWLVGSQATLGSASVFRGNIIANTESVILNSTAKILCGRAISLQAQVTMINNVISNDCANGGDFGSGNIDFGSGGFSGGPTSVIPEPSTFALLAVPLMVLVVFVRRSRRSPLGSVS